MANPPVLFDLDLLAARRRRAARAPEDFLQREAADLVQERLDEVNRPFTAPAIVGPRAAVWAEALRLDAPTLVADGDVLDLEEGAHDLVIHALALHSANDPVGQLVQMRRALCPDGLMIACAFGGRSLHELRTALAEAEVALTGGLSPRVAPMADLRDLGGLLQRAGLALPVADSFTLTVTYADLTALVRDLRAMGETNVLAARDRRVPPRALFARADQIYREAFGDAEGRLPVTVELVFLTGWAPAASQPQPLRPGSATARLADVLGTTEMPAGDAAPRPARDD